MSNTFGALINAQRSRLQLSIRELAKRVGVDAGYISKMEKGQISNPSFPVVMKLAKELDLNMQSLIEAFTLLEGMESVLNDYFNTGMPREEKDVIQAIMNGIVKISESRNFNGSVLSDVISSIILLHELKNQKTDSYFVITVLGDKWVNILQTPTNDETFLNLYYQLINATADDMTFVIKGYELVSVPYFVSNAQIITFEELLNKCNTANEEDDLYEVYTEIASYAQTLFTS